MALRVINVCDMVKNLSPGKLHYKIILKCLKEVNRNKLPDSPYSSFPIDCSVRINRESYGFKTSHGDIQS